MKCSRCGAPHVRCPIDEPLEWHRCASCRVLFSGEAVTQKKLATITGRSEVQISRTAKQLQEMLLGGSMRATYPVSQRV